jgi:hypothetical protein
LWAKHPPEIILEKSYPQGLTPLYRRNNYAYKKDMVADDHMEIDMTKQMNATAVAQIRSQMDAAKTSKGARKAMAKLALSRNNLTDCGRAEWQKELI